MAGSATEPIHASNIEQERLDRNRAEWLKWGPYLSERAWGTVREDYSADGEAWRYFPHDHARLRAYRWNEDGIAGISDEHQHLCFALALWNGRDPILKERMFGLTGVEGNHGEDVKEYYYYLDSTPTHSYMKMLYKYPQREFPYSLLLQANQGRPKSAGEFELIDTGIFEDNRYFDVFVEYAKATPTEILIKITAHNRAPVSDQPALLHLLPTLWYRDTWSWGNLDHASMITQGVNHKNAMLHAVDRNPENNLGHYRLYGANASADSAAPELLFADNDTNREALYNVPSRTRYTKDAFHRYLVHDQHDAVNPAGFGTKAALHYTLHIAPGESATLRLVLRREDENDSEPVSVEADPFVDFNKVFAAREQESDAFYAHLNPPTLDPDLQHVQRQALAGMLWSKQFYHYNVARWFSGDPNQPPPPRSRFSGRNNDWTHLDASEILSMPDKWEFPWFAAWDTAFHCIPLSLVDSTFAKEQLLLLMREWYQHPNGQIPAYEWTFSDVNPPVFAWAAWRIYKIEKKQRGVADRAFLERVFHKLLLNFTWWINRKDLDGNNVFQGGFLGLDNIGVFDRSAQLPTGGHLEQTDGTSWMGMFCLNMLAISLELAQANAVYEDIATKFLEHFLYIAAAMNNISDAHLSLWDNGDEFFYDVLHLPEGGYVPLRLRSLVGLIPLLAVETIEPNLLAALPGFADRLEWFLANRPQLAGGIL